MLYGCYHLSIRVVIFMGDGHKGGLTPHGCEMRGGANKALVLTAPALRSFGIIARHNRFGGGFGVVLPHTARARLHNAGVSIPSCNQS